MHNFHYFLNSITPTHFLNSAPRQYMAECLGRACLFLCKQKTFGVYRESASRHAYTSPRPAHRRSCGRPHPSASLYRFTLALCSASYSLRREDVAWWRSHFPALCSPLWPFYVSLRLLRPNLILRLFSSTLPRPGVSVSRIACLLGACFQDGTLMTGISAWLRWQPFAAPSLPCSLSQTESGIRDAHLNYSLFRQSGRRWGFGCWRHAQLATKLRFSSHHRWFP